MHPVLVLPYPNSVQVLGMEQPSVSAMPRNGSNSEESTDIHPDKGSCGSPDIQH